jgi:hypothetical protein
MDKPRQLISLLDSIAEELADLGVEIEQLQTTLSPAIFEIAKNPDYVRNVQTLDLLSQRLTAISAFDFSLNLAIPDDCIVNSASALNEVKLSALVDRLTGTEPAIAYASAGEVDLF